ncbi:MAG: hypothetical protein ACRC2T_10040 [Thermoguttaceae bacterium]
MISSSKDKNPYIKGIRACTEQEALGEIAQNHSAHLKDENTEAKMDSSE